MRAIFRVRRSEVWAVAGKGTDRGMKIACDAADLAPFAGGIFVPTMGALHAGHGALIERAVVMARGRRSRPAVVVSVFVNPTQFNEKCDFDRYPRTLEEDACLSERFGADCVFAPEVEVMYPPGVVAVIPGLPGVGTKPGLEDAHRPGHFAGVCQVCARLFELVRPGVAVFGEKDWQQLAVVRAMVEEEGLGIEIVACPTVREADGLAMSSRNRLLTAQMRRRAVSLFTALEEASRHGEAAEAERAGRGVLLASRVAPEYFVIRDAATLGSVREGKPARALVAARLVGGGAGGEGGVRLIDNGPWPGLGE